MGYNTEAKGDYSFAMGYLSNAQGEYSTAMGHEASASGNRSTAMGSVTFAVGNNSTAMGRFAGAIGDNSTAMGYETSAEGNSSFAMGAYSRAIGHRSTAMGEQTTAAGDNSVAMGEHTRADGDYSFAMGYRTEAESHSSVAIGRNNVGGGTPDSWVDTDPLFEIGIGPDDINRANAVTVLKSGNVGIGDIAPGAPLHVASGKTVLFGADTLGVGSKLMWLPSKSAFRAGNTGSTQWDWTNIGTNSFAAGNYTTASGDQSTAMGSGTTASGDFATAIGAGAGASGDRSVAMGTGAGAYGDRSTSIGVGTDADAYASIATGSYNVGGGNPTTWVDTDPIFEIGNGTGILDRSNVMTILKDGTVAMGDNTTASGRQSTAMGRNTTASGAESTALGNGTTASEDAATAMGNQTTASGINSTAMGTETKAEAFASTAIGSRNVGGGSPSAWFGDDPIFEIGIGIYDVSYENAMTVLKNGNVGIGPTSPDEKLEVDGGIKMGNTVNTIAGTIRWTGTDFEGYDGTTWRSLTGGGGSGGYPAPDYDSEWIYFPDSPGYMQLTHSIGGNVDNYVVDLIAKDVGADPSGIYLPDPHGNVSWFRLTTATIDLAKDYTGGVYVDSVRVRIWVHD
jgi:hypothetical protein